MGRQGGEGGGKDDGSGMGMWGGAATAEERQGTCRLGRADRKGFWAEEEERGRAEGTRAADK